MALAEKTKEPYPRPELADYPGAAQGGQLFTDYKCLQCHPTEISEGAPSASELAPNLNLAANRLRSDWIVEWLKDPQNQMPGTRMPSFFYDDGDYFFDDAPEQMDAIRDYLMTFSR
jgi:cytochrome c2